MPPKPRLDCVNSWRRLSIVACCPQLVGVGFFSGHIGHQWLVDCHSHQGGSYKMSATPNKALGSSGTYKFKVFRRLVHKNEFT